MKTADIRQSYLDYFSSKEHALVASASLLYNDPTLLFVNAGMVPFKPYFEGSEAAPFDRAVSCQKCVRTLDIDDVGKTTRHGTFFQMNGNFSFGDYFKAGAIEMAWELVTTETHNGGWGFDPDKIWVTVLHGDDEATKLWRKVGVPAAKIQPRGKKDNYWHMGVPGPGGPCSEIYVDRGPKYGPDGGPEADEDRFLEIWNLVFQQEEITNVKSKDTFDVVRPLATQNIDTGNVLERTALLLQGVENMYEIDEVFPVIQAAEEMCGRRYGHDPADDVRFRVVADHVRSGLMLMSDGVTPGNEARGYVLRRLLRRSIHAMRLLGVQDPVLSELLPVSRDLMKESYPDVAAGWARISDIAQAEEETFAKTLSAGTSIFDVAVVKTKEASKSVLSGEDAFKLHDTYGFPIDLTLEMAQDQGLSVDKDRFIELMKEQKGRARADAAAKKGGVCASAAYKLVRSEGETPFIGYKHLQATSKLRAIIRDGEMVDRALDGETVEIVLEETPFYAESGGQVGDAGTITGDGFTFEVSDVQRPVPGLVVHRGTILGEAARGIDAQAKVDAAHRFSGSQAHTATHVLHAALRELVGPTAVQAGSYNKPGYLRFDFSSTKGLSPALQQEIEERINVAIHDDFEVSDSLMPLEEAKAMGAMAMFGEKYPPLVRMVELAGAWSRELCGGTHVASTGQIGLVNLLGEASVGSGVRRVEALVSTDAFKKFAAERALLATITDTLKVSNDQVVARIEKLVASLKDAEKQIANMKAQQLQAGLDALVAKASDVSGVKVLGEIVVDASGNDLRMLAANARTKLGTDPAVVVLIGGDSEKAQAIVATNDAARELGLKAGTLIGAACQELGGRGGGKDDLAQGGGSDIGAAAKALDAVKKIIASRE